MKQTFYRFPAWISVVVFASLAQAVQFADFNQGADGKLDPQAFAARHAPAR